MSDRVLPARQGVELPLAVSMGEPAGIGPDIIVQSWARRGDASALPPFYVIADPDLVERRAAEVGVNVPIVSISGASECHDVFERALPVMPIELGGTVTAGQPSVVTARAVIASIDAAVSSTLAGQAAAVVTAPIAKSVLYEAGFTSPGHTEYLAQRATEMTGGAPCKPVMMIACAELRVVPLTIHIPLREVPGCISSERLHETIRTVAHALERDFSIASPRIAIAGLNPHAGEDGSMGREEIELIAPVIRSLVDDGFNVRGPLPADTMFHEAARQTYDAAICMYHDQALIPIKTLAFDRGVNMTLGLPFVRTSPDHGTAFDIAGTGRANPSSFVAALRLAQSASRARILSGATTAADVRA